jgi:hypothetical protein
MMTYLLLVLNLLVGLIQQSQGTSNITCAANTTSFALAEQAVNITLSFLKTR